MDAQLLKSKLTEKDIVKIIKRLGGELRSENSNEMIFDSITYDIDASSHKPKLYCYKSNLNFVEFHFSMETFDIYTPLLSLYRSNRYELVRANTL